MIARVGANAGSLYRVKGNYCVSDNTLILDLTESVDVDFVYNSLIQNNLNRLVFGSGQPLITGGQLKSLILSFPKIEEQKKIASLLTLIDARLSTQIKIIEALKVYRSTITDNLFHGFLSNHSFRFPEFIDDWQEYSFQDLLQVSTKRNFDNSIQTVLSASQTHGMVRRDEIDIDIKYDAKSTSTYKIVEPGDYVVHLRSFQGGFAFSEIGGICSPAYIILKPNLQLLEYGFLKTYFMSAKFIELLKLVTYGIRDGRSISVDEFLKLKIFIPAKPEQVKIQSFVQSMNTKLVYEERLRQALLKQKTYLLDNLFI